MNATDNPYAAPQAAVADVPSGATELATRGARFAAAFVDGLVAGLPVMLLGMLVGYFAAGSFPRWSPSSWVVQLVFALVYVALYLALNARLLANEGQTIGKRALGVRIVRSDGSRATLSHLLTRRFLPYVLLGQVPLLNLVVGIDPLLIFGSSRKCLHDITADTIVVKA